MQIQWFPGHMHKAQKEIRQVLAGIDVVVEVLDARIPFSSQNPLLAEIRQSKPCVKIINKHDLADKTLSDLWKNSLESADTRVVRCGLDCPGEVERIPKLCAELSPVIRETRPVHALIVGIPNVGKSTIINQLAGRKIARTGNEPAITKTQQRVDIGNGVVLRDTPGVLWPNVENRHSGYRLAATGAIKDTAMDSADVASYALEHLYQHYRARLIERYELDPVNLEDISDLSLSLIEEIGRQRGCIARGGLVDLDRAGRIVLTDLRSGALGRLTLETPDMMMNELKEVDRTRLLKEEKRKKKEAGRKAKRRTSRR